MTSSRLPVYGRWGARGIGICLIVSALLRPELPLMVTDYLADLFQGTPWSAADALVWLLIVLAGVGLIALRRGACFLVYIAFAYIQFVPGAPGGGCLCCGYPGIDWYRGSQRLALTSVQHGRAIRWKGFPGDAQLTEQSRKALCDWLKRHGISDEELR